MQDYQTETTTTTVAWHEQLLALVVEALAERVEYAVVERMNSEALAEHAATHIDARAVAEYVEIDYSELAYGLDSRDLADELADRLADRLIEDVASNLAGRIAEALRR